MVRYFKNLILFFSLAMVSITSYAQKDVTQFLGIPIDGYKPEMIQKLKSKGFIINSHTKDVLDGEFNGTDVNIFIATNNNKVWRIGVVDANDLSEGDIKIRFNKLIQQFQRNKNYLSTPDSTIIKYTIPDDEDISYEMSVKSKRYQAVFYQSTNAYDSLNKERENLLAKKNLTDADGKRLADLIVRIFEESLKSFDNTVWFMINERGGRYYITLFYDNTYNKANGEDL